MRADKKFCLVLTLLFSLQVSAQKYRIGDALKNFKNPAGVQKKSENIVAGNATGIDTIKVPEEQETKSYKIRKNGESMRFRFNNKNDVRARDFFRVFSKELNIAQADSFKFIKSEKDNIGYTQYRYQQYYKGIEVKGGEYILEEKEEKLVSVIGNFYSGLAINTRAGITKERAIQSALDHIRAAKYQWQDPLSEQRLKQDLNDPSATNYPKPELVIAPRSGIYERDNFRLCFKVKIAAEKPYGIFDVFVDSQTGAVINKISLIATSDVVATANTLYSGSKSITTDSYNGSYRLRESGRPIQTYNMRNGSSFTNAVDFTNPTTSWNTPDVTLNTVTISTVNNAWEDTFGEQLSNGGKPDIYIEIRDPSNTVVFTKTDAYAENLLPPFYFNTGGLILSATGTYTLRIYDYDATSTDDLLGTFTFTNASGTASFSANGTSGSLSRTSKNNPALDVHWAMEKVYDFYSTQLHRNSFNGSGGTIKNYLHPNLVAMGNPDNNNAFWNGTAMMYGDGDGSLFSSLTSMDVVGHEFTHGVVQYSGSGLAYQGESGALNESFADIFGTAVEFYGATNPNWTIGENIVLRAPYYLRSMSNPKVGLSSQPNTYNKAPWVSTSSQSDNGGVHTNSGVQNFWFYLLSQGGSGTNDYQNAYSVTGIGIAQATQIAYRTLTTKLSSNATYQSAYLGSLEAAQELFGNPSTQYAAVQKAWYAVGIGNNPTSYCSGTTTLTGATGTFSDGSGTASYSNNANCKWVISPANVSQITLSFTSFNTESDYDKVIIYDGPADTYPVLRTYSGSSIPASVTSTGGAMCVKFITDNEVTAAGWSATYTSSTASQNTCSGGTTLTTPTGTVTDGSGTAQYGNNQTCYWLIAPPCATSVTLSFTQLSTELDHDKVLVYNGNNTSAPLIGTYSGTSVPAAVTASSGEMLVVFVTDYATTGQGFTANYTSVGSAACTGTTVLNTLDYAMLTDGSGSNNYCNNVDCRWLIQPPQATSVTINFTNFDLEAPSSDGSIYDAVEIYNGTTTSAPLLGRFSGSNLPPSLTASSGSMLIRFFSDQDVNKAGWSAYYTSTSPGYCNAATTLTAATGTISDGSTTNQYANNSNCSWLIKPTSGNTITLAFSDFNTELNYDFVNIYNGSNASAPLLGSFSGSSLPSNVIATSGSMFVQFFSDEAIRANGWTANYTTSTTTSCVAPAITQQPTAQTVIVPNSCKFAVIATGSNNSYQWQVSTNGVNWSNITAAGSDPVYADYATPTLNVSGTVTANSGNLYRCTITSACTTSVATSTAATLTIGTGSACVAPQAPGNLTASIITSNQVYLSWSDNSNNETSFDVERSLSASGPFTVIGTTSTNTNGFSDANVIAGTTYYYRVKACCSATCSGYSNTANQSACSFSVTPTGISASVNTVCAGQKTQLTVIGGNLGTGASWKLYSGSCSGGALVGSSSAVSATIEVSPLSTTAYFFKAEGGCSSATLCATTIVNVNNLSTVTASTGAASVCVNGTTTLANITGGGVWSSNDVNKATVSTSGVVTGVSAGTVSILYTVAGACGPLSTPKLMTINPLPTVAAITGSTSVLVGSSITLACATTGGVWSTNSTKVTINSSGVVTGIAVGSVIISYTVTNGNGCVGVSTASVTVNAPPQITSFTPTSGYNGTTIIITGTNFSSATGVSFGGTPASLFNVLSATSIYAVVGAGATGNVSVSTTGGTATLAGFTYTNLPPSNPPTITSFSPASGPIGTTINITGTNFSTTPSNNTVFFGATKAIVTAASATQLTLSVPAGSTYQPITVTASNLTAYSDKPFTVTFTSTGVIDQNSFAEKTEFVPGALPQAIAINDIDGNGKPEIITGNQLDNSVSILRNTATSGVLNATTFAGKVDFTSGTNPSAIAFGDLDGDGKQDMVVANIFSNSVSVYRNTSTSGAITAGSFAAKVDFTTGAFPQSIAINDIDKDGKPDIIVANRLDNTISILKNIFQSGNITTNSFAAKVDFITGAGPQSLGIADLDGDKKPDVAVVNLFASTVSVFKNTSTPGLITSGSLASKIDFTTGSDPLGMGVGDIDGDGKVDLVITSSSGGTASILRNTVSGGTINSGSFAAKVDVPVGIFPQNIALGDLDGDGKPDILSADIGYAVVLKNTSTPGLVSFGSKVDLTTGFHPWNAVIGDVDGDGKADLVVANRLDNAVSGSNSISVFRNTMIPNCAPITGNTSLCVGSAATLTDATAGGAWTSSDPTKVTVSTAGVLLAISSGAATITYSVSGSNACTSSAMIIVNPNPVVVIASLSAVCSPATIDLTSVSVTAAGTTAGLSYTRWNNAAATSALANANAITASGTYYIKGTIPVTGCAVTVPVTVTVNPTPVVAAITGTPTVCVTGTAQLSNVTIGGVWGSTDATKATVNSSGLVTGIAAGTGKITYMVTSANGCTAFSEVSVTINPTPVVAAITGTPTVCVNSAVQLSNATTGGVWGSTDVSKATVNSTGLVTGAAGGTAKITYTVTNANGCITAKEVQVTVNTVPLKPVITWNGTDLVSSITAGNEWYNDAGKIAGATSQTYRPSLSGYYRVQANNFGCISPLSDAYYFLVTAVSNTSSANNENYQINPNPVKDVLIIKAKNTTQKISVQIMTIEGKVAITKTFVSTTSIGMQQLPSGTYSIRLINLKTMAHENHIIIKQ